MFSKFIIVCKKIKIPNPSDLSIELPVEKKKKGVFKFRLADYFFTTPHDKRRVILHRTTAPKTMENVNREGLSGVRSLVDPL